MLETPRPISQVQQDLYYQEKPVSDTNQEGRWSQLLKQVPEQVQGMKSGPTQ